MEKDTDEQLIKRYRGNKDEAALEELIRRYLPRIFGFVKRYTGNEETASDITQDTFVKVWKNIKNFDSSKSFKTWIFTIAKRTAIDELREKKSVPFSMLSNSRERSFGEFLADESVSFFEKILMRQESKELAFAISKLPANYSQIINLRLKDNLKMKEIAEALKEPLNTIKSRYRRGLNLLKKIL
jgi:RNA polymerase sigma-70 factor (ECF subfamily)